VLRCRSEPDLINANPFVDWAFDRNWAGSLSPGKSPLHCPGTAPRGLLLLDSSVFMLWPVQIASNQQLAALKIEAIQDGCPQTQLWDNEVMVSVD
jgi:hypothetical protein